MNVNVSSTNDSKTSKSYVKVYVDGLLAAVVSPPKRNPLRYMRQHPKSKYWGMLVAELRRGGYEEQAVTEIMYKVHKGD